MLSVLRNFAGQQESLARSAQSVWNDRLEFTKSWVTLRAARQETQSHMVKGAGHGEEYTICWDGRARGDDRGGSRTVIQLREPEERRRRTDKLVSCNTLLSSLCR